MHEVFRRATDVTFDESGRPYFVWWRDENGQGRVYLSIFLVTLWMESYAVSDPAIDARYPTIELGDEGVILVLYDTPQGTIEHTVLFDEPVTITDDIDPLDHISSGNTRYIGDADP